MCVLNRLKVSRLHTNGSMNVIAQSQNVSELREVNESNFPLAEELKGRRFCKALRSVNRQVHLGMSLRPDAIVSLKYSVHRSSWPLVQSRSRLFGIILKIVEKNFNQDLLLHFARRLIFRIDPKPGEPARRVRVSSETLEVAMGVVDELLFVLQ